MSEMKRLAKEEQNLMSDMIHHIGDSVQESLSHLRHIFDHQEKMHQHVHNNSHDVDNNSSDSPKKEECKFAIKELSFHKTIAMIDNCSMQTYDEDLQRLKVAVVVRFAQLITLLLVSAACMSSIEGWDYLTGWYWSCVTGFF